MATTNSKVTRVQPVFRWLEKHGGIRWGEQLVRLASGLAHRPACGAVRGVQLSPEAEVGPTPQRLAWMIRNAHRLVPQNGQQWRQLGRRVRNREAIERALSRLDCGEVRGVPKALILEGKTHADCLIECEGAFIWIEGKRLDWLSPCTTWDVNRDQLARNVEAVWTVARRPARTTA